MLPIQPVLDLELGDAAEFAGLEALAEIAGKKVARGVVLYDGDAVVPFGERMVAAPVHTLWEA